MYKIIIIMICYIKMELIEAQIIYKKLHIIINDNEALII